MEAGRVGSFTLALSARFSAFGPSSKAWSRCVAHPNISAAQSSADAPLRIDLIVRRLSKFGGARSSN